MSSPALTPATARAHAMAAAETYNQTLYPNIVLSELIAFLPTATVCEFMEEFNQHLKCGDFDYLIN